MKARVRAWLLEDALPLWRGVGVDDAGFGVFEALDHAGAPLADLAKRLRVQARQVYVFAAAAAHLGTDDAALARRLFEETMRVGLTETGGRLVQTTDRAGTPLSTPHDLYDLTFMILADATLRMADGNSGPNEALWSALERLRAPRGWREAEAEAPRNRRRQNPHMHLFEASLAQMEAGDDRYRAVAAACLDLFRTVFLGDDGVLLEYFDDDLAPVAEGQATEPGHMAEWIFLLDWWERLTGAPAGVDLAALFRRAETGRDASGFLIDAVTPLRTTRRLWPQTEYLKAALVMARRGAAPPALADEIVEAIFVTYLSTPTPGGWWDQFDKGGALVSSTMPASTFYHLMAAFLAYLDAPEAGGP